MSLGDARLRLGEPLGVSGHPRTLCPGGAPSSASENPLQLRAGSGILGEGSRREVGGCSKSGSTISRAQERVAVVTDVEWIRCAVKCLRLRDARRSPALRRVRSACHSPSGSWRRARAPCRYRCHGLVGLRLSQAFVSIEGIPPDAPDTSMLLDENQGSHPLPRGSRGLLAVNSTVWSVG